ncbi:glycosyltransferase family 4 protein [Paramicrobacterium chengjingii]|uniref:glycosyltransferase family 4 protein n=1 Tax=Paramicrobacterium chengjingii TaxID=2769067 RepID=UPI00141F83F2|nr:glycosyltransferase family 4 protein [Microbacterium chengjingii]
MSRPRILCISLSPIERDARVLRQISVLAEYGDVVTVGYGDTPAGATEHISVPSDLPSLPQDPIGVLKLATRQFRRAELSAPGIRFAKKALAGASFDLVVANDARVLDLAFSVAGAAPVWADMHEWAPEERTHVLSWRLLVAPFMTHLCRTYLPRSAAVTTVGGRISDLYSSVFGVRPRVMRNAAPYAELEPQPVAHDSIRLVHSGAAVHGRNLELMIDAMKLLDDRFTLDLYLVSAADGGAYLNQLRERAAGDARIAFKHPVKPNDLPRTLNSYDVGVFWIPPVHTNARYTLPNKLFDFVQARLAVAIGPSEEMVDVVTQYDLGVISRDFTAESCADSLRSLTADAVTAFKAKTDAAARELSFETEAQVARSILAEALSR